MSILIKGMEIPNIENNESIKAEIYNLNGKLKLRIMTGDYYCSQHWIYYPIVSIPTPHGQLKDEKQLKEYIAETIKNFEKMNRSDLEYYSLIAALRTVEVMIEHIPTIIEAEIEEKGKIK